MDFLPAIVFFEDAERGDGGAFVGAEFFDGGIEFLEESEILVFRGFVVEGDFAGE